LHGTCGNIAHAANKAAIRELITTNIYIDLETNEYPSAAAYLFTEGMREKLVSANLSTQNPGSTALTYM
jgi:hypothetical protein